MMLMMMMMGDDADADDTQRSQDSDLVCLSPTTKMNQSWSKPEGKMGYNGGTVWGTIVCNMGYNWVQYGWGTKVYNRVK